MTEVDKVRDEEGTTEVEADLNVEQAMSVGENTFFRVEIFTGDANVTLDILDPTAAQTLVTNIVKQGIFHQPIENGVQAYPVKSAKVTGPYELPVGEVVANEAG